MAKVGNLKLTLQQATGQNTGTIIAAWTFTRKHVDHYAVTFYYRTANTYRGKYVWYDGTSTTTKRKSITWDIPEDAYSVQVSVKPIATKHKVKKGKKTKEVYWWNGQSKSASKWVKNVNYRPATPSAPTLSLKENGNLRAEVSSSDERTQYIDFYFYRHTQNNTKSGSKTVQVKVSAGGTAAAEIKPEYLGYRYKVRARGVSNAVEKYKGSWSDYSDDVVTKPNKVLVSAILTDKNKSIVRVKVNPVYGAETYKVQYTNRKDVWSGEGVAETTIEKGLSYVDVSVEPGKQYWVRAKAINKDSVEGEYGTVTEVIVGKKPAPPTTWSDRVTAKVGQAVMLYWVHNAVDGSPQQLSQVEVNALGVTNIYDVNPKIDPNTGENSNKGEYPLSTGNYPDQTKIRWRVRTKGIFDEWSDWSTQREVTLYSPPTLEVNVYQDAGDTSTPIDTADRFPFYIVAESGPSTQKAIGFYISILSNVAYTYTAADGTEQTINSGEEVYSKFFDFSSSETSVEFGDYATVRNNILTLKMSADNVDLEEGVEYTIHSSVSMNTGLEANAENIFSIGWKDEAQEPDCEFIYDEDTLSMSIVPYCEVPANFDPSQDYPDDFDYQYKLAEGVTLSVYRREPNGELTLVADNIPNDRATAVPDPHPSLNDALYRIVATTTLTGAVAYYDPPGYPIGETDIVIQWGENWEYLQLNEVTDQDTGDVELNTGMDPSWSGSMLRLPYNIDTSENTSPDVALIKPIGRKRPVSHYGTQLGESATWNTEFPKSDIETINMLRRLQSWTGDVYVREPSGTGYWANVTLSFNLTHCEVVVPVTINVTRVEGGL